MTERLTKLNKLLQDSPGNSFLHYAIAKEYETMGQNDLALAKYKELVKMDPDYIGTYYHLGKLMEALDLSQEAMKTYNLGIEVCKKAQDMHSLSELQNAKTNLELELG